MHDNPGSSKSRRITRLFVDENSWTAYGKDEKRFVGSSPVRCTVIITVSQLDILQHMWQTDKIFPVVLARVRAIPSGDDLVGIKTGKGSGDGCSIRIDNNDLPHIILSGQIEQGIELVPADCNLALVFHQACKIIPAGFRLEEKDILPYEGSDLRFLQSIADQHMPADPGIPHRAHQDAVYTGEGIVPLLFIIIEYIGDAEQVGGRQGTPRTLLLRYDPRSILDDFMGIQADFSRCPSILNPGQALPGSAHGRTCPRHRVT